MITLPLVLTVLLNNPAKCYNMCHVHITFVNTRYGTFDPTWKLIYADQINNSGNWWKSNLDETLQLSYTVEPDMYAVDTNTGVKWLESVNEYTWNLPNLYIYIVFSPAWNYRAWVSNNIMVVYTTGIYNLEYVFAHEYGHLLYGFPDIFSSNGIMGKSSASAYNNNTVGCEIRDLTKNPCFYIYIPEAIS